MTLSVLVFFRGGGIRREPHSSEGYVVGLKIILNIFHQYPAFSTRLISLPNLDRDGPSGVQKMQNWQGIMSDKLPPFEQIVFRGYSQIRTSFQIVKWLDNG